jgi:hypothetical protein
MKISVCAPSYKRPTGCETPAYLPFVRVYVDPSEAKEYRRANPGVTIVECAKGVQGNLCRVRNHILDRELRAGADVVLIVDDDLEGIYYWQKAAAVKPARIRVETKVFLGWVEKYSIMARDIGAFLWGLNVNNDKACYREYTPFSTTAYIGGPFQAIMRGCGLRYDENLPLKEDYDFSLQHLNRYRRTFRVNKAYYMARQSEQRGGCATYRNMEREKAQLLALQEKWGSTIVKIDAGRKAHMRENKSKGFDYNPIIHIPIPGV